MYRINRITGDNVFATGSWQVMVIVWRRAMEYKARICIFEKMFDRIALLRASENSYPPFTRILSIAYSYLRYRRNDEQTKKYVIKYPSFIIKKRRRKKREKERER